jgi:hypothetical protein
MKSRRTTARTEQGKRTGRMAVRRWVEDGMDYTNMQRRNGKVMLLPAPDATKCGQMNPLMASNTWICTLIDPFEVL